MTTDIHALHRGHIERITREQSLEPSSVSAAAALLDDGATVPFIARYRKEATGSLDEVQIMAVRDRLQELRELDKRREAILASLGERELLTDELEEAVRGAETMTELEDIYLPYRPKRRTRATIARERGLEPLAELIFRQDGADPLEEAAHFIDPEKDVETVEDALAGARDIIAEWVSENAEIRDRMRRLFVSRATFRSTVVSGLEEEGAKYRDYFDWEELAREAPSHRILAMRRGEQEGMLRLRVVPPEDEALALLESLAVTGKGACADQVRTAAQDGYKRLLGPSLETEMRLATKQRADEEAVSVFADNVRELLLSPPLGGKRVMALDPGFRTGCKVCCLDSGGALVHHTTVFPHTGDRQADEAEKTLAALIASHDIEVVAVGNGTAGRETETFLRERGIAGEIQVVMVNESGASVYSASEAAREEFPDEDVTVRGSVSIGRRLMDPLAELVKIDPKSIGVGQYQHDVDQQLLKRRLDDVVMSCVNTVGVDLNTASRQLLSYVSGVGPALAKNIVEYREQAGPFASRRDILNVRRFGEKAFEQAAGFLRIPSAANPLDRSAVHPESYHIVESMARDLDAAVADLLVDEGLRKRIALSKYVTDTVGMPTLADIMAELAKPGRDPRERFEIFSFSPDVKKMDDLRPGMRLPGIVTNVTAFGAFVDVGVHQDGLVHISQLADRFVKNPADMVKVHQKVTVTVLDVDVVRRRISLSMKKQP